MGKILVFLYDDMADFELIFATHMLGADMGKELVTIAYEDKLISSKAGIVYKPSKRVMEVLDEDLDAEALIIPGGWNGEIRPELMTLIQTMHEKGKLLAAICAGPRFLAKAGVLEHARYTTSIVEWTQTHTEKFAEQDPFPRQNFVADRVVRDRNVITATGTAFVDFAIEIADWFSAFEDQADKDNFTKLIKGIE